MPLSDDFYRALQDYRLAFPGVDSLGSGDPPATWLAERNRVRTIARSSVLFTGTSTEGASASGQRQFPQSVLIDALDYRRHELDEDYELPAHLKRKSGGGMSFQFSP